MQKWNKNPFFIHQWTPDKTEVAPFTIAIQCQYQYYTKHTVGTKKHPWECFKKFKISKLCAITISQHKYLL